MADDFFDLTPFLNEIVTEAEALSLAEELLLQRDGRGKPISITGTWDNWPVPPPTCGICGETFADAPEGIAYISHEAIPGYRCPACPQCAIALIADDTED